MSEVDTSKVRASADPEEQLGPNPPRAFQGYISPEVEDAIKNDHGGKYVLDFLRNKLMIIDVVVPSTKAVSTIASPVSFERVKEAMQNGAFVMAVFRIVQMSEQSSARASSGDDAPDGTVIYVSCDYAMNYDYYGSSVIYFNSCKLKRDNYFYMGSNS